MRRRDPTKCDSLNSCGLPVVCIVCTVFIFDFQMDQPLQQHNEFYFGAVSPIVDCVFFLMFGEILLKAKSDSLWQMWQWPAAICSRIVK